MKSTKMLAIVVLTLGLLLCVPNLVGAEPIGTAFTYQGRLIDANTPADGLYDFQFRLYDAAADGNQIGTDVNIADVNVTDGQFTLALDFGNVFDGNAVWLQVGVRPGETEDPNTYTTLSPRRQVSPAPYAIYAATASAVAQAAGGGIVPTGGIIMWSGSIADIPKSWALCDGTNGTPDLRDRFIVGAGNSYDVNGVGGEAFHTLTIAEMPSHSHASAVISEGPHAADGHDYDDKKVQKSPGPSGSAGGGQPHENRPPYFALAYIMKL